MFQIFIYIKATGITQILRNDFEYVLSVECY